MVEKIPVLHIRRSIQNGERTETDRPEAQVNRLLGWKNVEPAH